MHGTDIHFNLVDCNQWEEAETFFAWLGLSSAEVRDLKKDTLLNHGKASYSFIRLLNIKEGGNEFVEHGSKQEAIGLLLRWYLPEKDEVLEFVDKFKTRYSNIIEEDELKFFYSMIEQHLGDID